MYDDVNEMYYDLLHELMAIARTQPSSPSRDGEMAAEVLGWHAVLDTSKQKTLVTLPAREVSIGYAAAEVLWYMSGADTVDMIEPYAVRYREKYADADGTAGAAYGFRIMAQLPDLLAAMERRPESRQAYLSIWDPLDLEFAERPAVRKNIPCSTGWQVLARDGKLHMVHTLRSNDAWLGFLYDVFSATSFQRHIAAKLGLEVGTYHHFAGSMHLYERYRAKAEKLVAEYSDTPVDGHGWTLGDDSMMADLRAACAQHLGDKGRKPRSPRLRSTLC